MNRFDMFIGSSVRRAAASAVVASFLFGFVSVSAAGNKLPTRVPPSNGGNNGHASAKFRVAITILPAPAASKSSIKPQQVSELDGRVEHFSGYVVKTTIADTHISMDVE